jgi:hypothetical protein
VILAMGAAYMKMKTKKKPAKNSGLELELDGTIYLIVDGVRSELDGEIALRCIAHMVREALNYAVDSTKR